MSPTRSVLVDARRLDGWLARFEARNGPYTVSLATGRDDGSLDVVAGNGCTALLTPPLPPRARPGGESAAGSRAGTGSRATTEGSIPPASGAAEESSPDADGLVPSLLSGIDTATTVGLLLIRRGGYSVGAAAAGQVLASKTGTRYVQGRTAAGGWSQQRFARRRANQADALVEETAVRAAAVFRAHPPSCLQLGGDRTLAAAVLGEPALTAFAKLPQVPFLTVPDPRFAVLKEAAGSALSVRITVTDPPST